MKDDRISVKFVGQSGQGINTLGKILSKSIKDSNFFPFAYREYPSLIRGGHASYQIDISNKKIASSTRKCDILPVLNKKVLNEYVQTVEEGGVIIHDDESFSVTEENRDYIEKNSIKTIYLNTVEMALEAKGEEIMANMVLIGYIWKLLDLNIKPLEENVIDNFKHKDVDIDAEIRCLMAGYNSADSLKPIKFKRSVSLKKHLSITGNEGIALGAIAGGLRAYYAYPMTPATSILRFLGDTYKETGIVVKQAENEITAALMTLGSMAMGTRAMTATSGGGFDLMTETISCSGISETPLVVVLAQRIGPGTGVPTWTGSGDILLATRAGHGEFPRCVISISNPEDGYKLTQEALNIAEIYQIPVIILTEKQIAESIFCIEKLPKALKIERGLSSGNKRYEITESGISNRWAPQEGKKPYINSSDEHDERGVSTERSSEIIEMSDKRMRKLETLKESIAEPEYFGSKNPDIVFVGYGSVGNAIKDVVNLRDDIGYLHYSYIYPLITQPIIDIFEDGARVVLVENNQTGEFGQLVRRESGFEFSEKLLKYDGRPVFVDDILDFLDN